MQVVIKPESLEPQQEVHSRRKLSIGRIGTLLYAGGTIAAGVFDLIWREFEAAHQPIGALGDHIPGVTVLAFITAIWMIASGVAVLVPRTSRTGALSTALIYTVFAAFWLPRFYSAPHALGFSVALMIGLLAGIFTQIIAIGGGLILYQSAPGEFVVNARSLALSRVIFGGGAIFFGLVHLTSVHLVARMVPTWIPFGGAVAVVISGIAFLLAGLAIISGVLSTLAAWLLGFMLLLFEPLVLLPNLIADSHNHVAWGANAYNLAAAGAVWIFAASLHCRRTGCEQ